MEKDKIIIVGGGIAGLSLAVLLAREGAKVRLYEQEAPGYGASGRSAGIVVTIMPETLLDYSLASIAFYRSLEWEAPLVRSVSALWFAPSRKCMLSLLESHGKRGLASRPAGMGEIPPGIVVGDEDNPAIVEEYIVDVGSTVNALQTVAASLGVDIVYRHVTGVGDGWVLSSGIRDEGTVVVAAGAWSRGLLQGRLEGLVEYRCQLSSVEGERPNILVEDDVNGFYIVPIGESRMNIGDGSNTPISDPLEGYNTDLEDMYNVIERAASRIPSLWESRLVSAWSAPCNTSPDGLPAAGALDENLYVLTGFNGAGLTLAPAVAGELAGEILGSGTVNKIFRVERLKHAVTPRSWPPEPYDPCLTVG